MASAARYHYFRNSVAELATAQAPSWSRSRPARSASSPRMPDANAALYHLMELESEAWSKGPLAGRGPRDLPAARAVCRAARAAGIAAGGVPCDRPEAAAPAASRTRWPGRSPRPAWPRSRTASTASISSPSSAASRSTATARPGRWSTPSSSPASPTSPPPSSPRSRSSRASRSSPSSAAISTG